MPPRSVGRSLPVFRRFEFASLVRPSSEVEEVAAFVGELACIVELPNLDCRDGAWRFSIIPEEVGSLSHAPGALTGARPRQRHGAVSTGF